HHRHTAGYDDARRDDDADRRSDPSVRGTIAGVQLHQALLQRSLHTSDFSGAPAYPVAVHLHGLSTCTVRFDERHQIGVLSHPHPPLASVGSTTAEGCSASW